VGLCLPYTIEDAARENPQRYAEMARYLGLAADSATQGATSLVQAVTGLLKRLGQPTTLSEVGIEIESLKERMETLVDNAANEASTVVHPRIPSPDELERLLLCAHEGGEVGF
jgi:acetaldehyde dehydrogenase/alcohol dehydrogenase